MEEPTPVSPPAEGEPPLQPQPGSPENQTAPQPSIVAVPEVNLRKLAQSEDERFETFADWPHEHPSAALLAAAGFYHHASDAGNSNEDGNDGEPYDEIRCPECGTHFSGFNLRDTSSNTSPSSSSSAAAANHDTNNNNSTGSSSSGRSSPGDVSDVWNILSHGRDCSLRHKLGESKNRSCGDCYAVFSTVGSKLNHCKRIHPRPEEEKRRRAAARAEKRRERDVTRQLLHAGSKRVTKIRANKAGGGAAITAAAAVGRPRGIGSGTRRGGAVAGAARSAWVVRATPPELGEARRGGGAPDSDDTDDDGGRVNATVISNPNSNGDDAVAEDDRTVSVESSSWDGRTRVGGGPLRLSGLVVNMDCEPCPWQAGEVVMSRTEYREFRQHFRAMTQIFRDIDPKKRV